MAIRTIEVPFRDDYNVGVGGDLPRVARWALWSTAPPKVCNQLAVEQ